MTGNDDTQPTAEDEPARANGPESGDPERSTGIANGGSGRAIDARIDEFAVVTDTFVRGIEMAAATVFALLFAIGVFDLAMQIVTSVRTGRIADPLVVIGFIDTGLLLLIIVEVYQTVIAYVQESRTRRIVRLVIYTGVIAMVRKAIIFRTGEYPTTQDALLAALAYTVIIVGLVGLLLVERVYGEDSAE